MILIDTSVWIEHFRRTVPELADLLEAGRVLIHSWIIGELACGNLKNRTTILSLLDDLPKIAMPTHEEAMFFLERHRLMGRGIGYVDLHLLAATALNGDSRLWSLDKRLGNVAAELNLHFAPSQ